MNSALPPATRRPFSSPDVRLRAGLLAALILCNPLLYAWWTTTGGVFPDSVAYLLLAKALVHDGLLSVAGLGHVDHALILPPVYPLLTGAGTLVFDDAVLVSQWLSGAALIAAVVPLFLWLERASNPWLAAAGVAVVEWQPFYMQYGTSTLTEGLFILGICLTGYAAGRLLERPRLTAAACGALGVAVGAVFLTRLLGIFLLPVLVAFIAIARRHDGWRANLRAGAALLAGFFAVSVPYGALLHAQTGQMPWTQGYRLHQYVVAPAEGAGAAAGVATPQDYTAALVERRQLRRLNDEGTEMLGDLAGPPARKGPLHWMSAPSKWLANLRANLVHALALLGPAAVLAAMAGAVLCCLGGPAAAKSWRLLLAGTVIGYLALLSTMTGLIARYIDVLAPFLVGLAGVGVQGLIERLRTPPARATLVQAGAGVLTGALILLSQPAAPKSPALRKYGEATNPLAHCREFVAPGAGVLSFHAFEPYLLGGVYRIVPNDSLDRIAAYARHTGTRWLLFRPNAATGLEVQLYDRAAWLRDPTELFRNANYAARCASGDSTAVLFEITPAPEGPGGLPGVGTPAPTE